MSLKFSVRACPLRRDRQGSQLRRLLGVSSLVLATVSLSSWLWVGSWLASEPASASSWTRYSLVKRFSWPRAAVWMAGVNRSLLVSDLARNDGKLFRVGVGTDAGVSGPAASVTALAQAGTALAGVGLGTPYLLRRNSSTIFLEDKGLPAGSGEILRPFTDLLRSAGTPLDLKKISWTDTRNDSDWTVDDIWDWIPFEGGTIGLVTLSRESTTAGTKVRAESANPAAQAAKQHDLALAYFRSSEFGEAEVQVFDWRFTGEFGSSDAYFEYAYLKGFLASAGEEAYFLDISRDPTLFRLSAESLHAEPVLSLPGPYKTRALLSHDPLWQAERVTRQRTPGSAMRQSVLYYQLLEKTPTVVGLAAYRDQLYLAGKGGMSLGGVTSWWLAEVDVASGAIGAPSLLPTSAAHLTIASPLSQPDAMWAFFERDQVLPRIGDGVPTSNCSSVVLVKASAIDSP